MTALVELGDLRRKIEQLKKLNERYADYAKPLDEILQGSGSLKQAKVIIDSSLKIATQAKAGVEQQLKLLNKKISESTKVEKKQISDDMVKICTESKYYETMSEADELMWAISTRLSELKMHISEDRTSRPGSSLSSSSQGTIKLNSSDNLTGLVSFRTPGSDNNVGVDCTIPMRNRIDPSAETAVLYGSQEQLADFNQQQKDYKVSDFNTPIFNGPAWQAQHVNLARRPQSPVGPPPGWAGQQGHHGRSTSPAQPTSMPNRHCLRQQSHSQPIGPSILTQNVGQGIHQNYYQPQYGPGTATHAQQIPAYQPHCQVQGSNHGQLYNQTVCYSTKPPKMTLPKFDGKAGKFTEFWSIFQVAVHHSPILSVTEKMIHLKQCLVGNAALVIEGIELVPQNYEWMVNTLRKKYENTPQIRQQIISELNNMQPASKDPDHCAEVLQRIRAYVNKMISSGADVGSSIDGTWITIISGKFPFSILEKVHEQVRNQENLTVNQFIEVLDGIIENKKFAKAAVQSTKEFSRRYEHGNDNSKSPPSTNSGCELCEMGGPHKATACRNVSDGKERIRIACEKQLCKKCFKKHSTFDCKIPPCSCKRHHHPSLCGLPWPEPNIPSQPRINSNLNRQSPRDNSRSYPSQREERQPNHGASNQRTQMNPIIENDYAKKQVVLMTAEASIKNNEASEFEKVLIFFDSGSQASFIEAELATRLKLKHKRTERTTLSGIGGISESFDSHVVEAQIKTPFGSQLYVTLRTKPVITSEFQAAEICEEDLKCLSDNYLTLSNHRTEGENILPRILVGLDLFQFLVKNMYFSTLPSGLNVAQTKFGYCAWGVGAAGSSQNRTKDCSLLCSPAFMEKSENEMIKELYELEGIGLRSFEEDHNAMKYYADYKNKIVIDKGIITAPFPLKENVAKLTDNFGMALRRLENLQKKLQTNNEQQHWYRKILNDYVANDIVEEVDHRDKLPHGVYYMPHSGVWRAEKQKPLRIVFDASSKQRGALSFNEVCHQGELFNKKLFDILVNARNCDLIMTCDLEAAFTQIRIREDQRNYCRFLWLKDPDKKATPDNIVAYRFKRLPFGLTCSPSILNMTLTHFLTSKKSALADEILNNLYVDNILLTAKCEEEALEKYRLVKELFREISINVREFVSNSTRVNSLIPEIDRGKLEKAKLLGVCYDIQKDQLSATVSEKLNMKTNSKRAMLSALHSVYDPLGFLNPEMLQFKLMFREITEQTLTWQQPIPKEIETRWKRAAQSLIGKTISAPRSLQKFLTNDEHRSLFIFADASTEALAACAYYYGQNGFSELICGKNKLAPRKRTLTIPQLELMAIHMGITLARSIIEANGLGTFHIKIVSDSEIALAWLKSKRRLMMSVVSQADKIKNLKRELESQGHEIEFYHVPGDHNVADIATRKLCDSGVNTSSWITGPKWFKTPKSQWPLTPLGQLSCDEFDFEDQESQPLMQLTQTVLESPPSIIEADRFSSWTKLLRTTVRVGKALKKWARIVNSNDNQKIRLKISDQFNDPNSITAEELEASRTILLQQEHKHVNIGELRKRFRNMLIFRDEDGLIRLDSRLANSLLPIDTVKPILLLPYSRVTELIVSNLHRENAHAGREHLKVLIRQKYWLPKASSVLKKVLNGCVTCKKVQGLPLGAPNMPNLPEDRVVKTKAFENTGIDCFGPYTSKTGEKIYACIFTCLTTRAIHLEPLPDMTGTSFLNAFTRFTSRRGVPKIARSDCGTNFVLAEKVLKQLSSPANDDDDMVMTYFSHKGIRWLYNIPGSPWTGGVWERLISSVKRAFTKMIGRKRLTYEVFETTLAAIEAILNTRPLTVTTFDDGTCLPLRPVDFLQPYVQFAIDSGTVEDSDDPDYDPEAINNVKQATEAYNHVTALLDKFWERWHREYLTAIKDIHKFTRRQPRHGAREVPEVGEIVLVENELLHRGCWTYGKIEKINESRDGMIRSAQVKVPNGHILSRPLNKLYPLEIRCSQKDEKSSSEISENSIKPRPNDQNASASGNAAERPTVRKAKLKAVEEIKSIAKELNADDSTVSAFCTLLKPNAGCFNWLMIIMTLMCLTNAEAVIQVAKITADLCQADHISLPALSTHTTVCYDEFCFSAPASNNSRSFPLPVRATTKHSTIKLITNDFRIAQLCDLPHICSISRTMLSRALIGNPSCWPLGAMISVCVLIYFALTSSLGCVRLLWKVIRKVAKSRSADPQNVEAEEKMTTKENSAEQSEPYSPPRFDFRNFQLPKLSLMIILSLTAAVHACSWSFSRQSVDLICDQEEHCQLTLRKEVIFDPLHRDTCLEMRANDQAVGLLKISHVQTTLFCNKETLYFTRETKHEVFSTFRCLFMGSCDLAGTCENLQQSDIVDEIAEGKKYPGYSACVRSCGGPLCFCVVPAPGCEFYRVAHIPQSELAYEIFQCSSFSAEATITIETTLQNSTSRETMVLKPYETAHIPFWNVTVLSMEKPSHSVMKRRFASSDQSAYALPDEFTIATKCKSKTEAEDAFDACINAILCECQSINDPVLCNCPYNVFSELHQTAENVLPFSTPQFNFRIENHDLVATTSAGELTILLESQETFDMSTRIDNQQCSLSATTLVGCYSCLEGCALNITCTTENPSNVVIMCPSQTLSVPCNKNGLISTQHMAYDRAYVNEACYATCRGKEVKLVVAGHLVFYPQPLPIPTSPNSSHPWNPFDWFDNMTLPDLEPLVQIFSLHWRLAIALLIGTLILIGITVAMGPELLIAVIRLILALTKLAVQLVILVIRSLIEGIRLCCSKKGGNRLISSNLMTNNHGDH